MGYPLEVDAFDVILHRPADGDFTDRVLVCPVCRSQQHAGGACRCYRGYRDSPQDPPSPHTWTAVTSGQKGARQIIDRDT